MHVSQSLQSSSLNTNEYSLTCIKFLGQTPAHSPQYEHQSFTIIKISPFLKIYVKNNMNFILFKGLVKNNL